MAIFTDFNWKSATLSRNERTNKQTKQHTDQEMCWRCTRTPGFLPCQTQQNDSALCSAFAWTETTNE